MTSRTDRCMPLSMTPATTPDRPTIEPMDRSIPPVRMTSSMPRDSRAL